MSKDLKEEDESKWIYDGKEEDWDMFDHKMSWHMLKKYDVFGAGIHGNYSPALQSLYPCPDVDDSEDDDFDGEEDDEDNEE
jgi:hypothetical protein